MTDVNFHIQKMQSLRTDRSTFESQWEEAAERIIPAHKGSFFSRGMTSAFTPGMKNTEKMFDSTASLALHRFMSVMESLAVPQGQQWHRLTPSDPKLRKNRLVRLYLDEVNSLLFRYRYRPTANFVGQMQKAFMGYGAYGNGIMFVDELGSDPGLRYKSLDLSETYFCENHQGIVDTLYRSFRLKPAQIVSEFGDKAPQTVKNAMSNANQTNTTYEIMHCIYPRSYYNPMRKDGAGMAFASLYIFVEEKSVISEGGYATFPAAIARYTQYANEVYGRGPAQLVLPAIKVLNEEKKTILKQGHRIVDPVLLAYDDGAVGTFSIKPGAINPGRVNSQGKPMVHALPTGNLAVGQELMQDERDVINDAFLITLFQILVDAPSRMTATEVLERTREKGMLIAPTAGRLQAECLGPMIEREVDSLERQGLLPPIPYALRDAGAGYTVEYDSPMSRMARAENAAGFYRSLDAVNAIVTVNQDMSLYDHFNFDVAIPAIQDINGAPTAWTSSPEEVEKKRAARAEQQQTQQAIEAAPAAAGMLKTVAEI